MAQQPRVVAVVVTWNRWPLLQRSLSAVSAQSRPPEAVVVVDNASTDGTPQAVRRTFPAVEVVEAAHNTGGAGGFAAGLTRALALHADLIWLMDDDTEPRPDALATLLEAHQGYAGPPPALVASRVVWSDGRDHPMNTPRVKPGARSTERAAAAEVGCKPIRSASFVSVLCDAQVVRERGLPMADYFLWNDDFEYTTRLIRGRPGLYCPASVAVHNTKTFGATDADPGERFYYEVRNKVWLFTRSRGLSPLEKGLYAGSTLRRWIRTIARSSDRATLVRALRRGLVSGVRTAPRDTAKVLADAGVDPSSGAAR